MRPWIRLYTELISDPSFRRLSLETRCAWYELLLWATPGAGMAPGLEDLAWEWRTDARTLKDWLAPLVSRGWVVVHPDGIEVVNWAVRQPRTPNEATRERQRRYRERAATLPVTSRDASRNASRRSEAEAEAEAEAEVKSIPSLLSCDGTDPCDPVPQGGREHIELASWVPGYYLDEGYQPSDRSAVVKAAMNAPGATRERLLRHLTAGDGIVGLARMAAEGTLGRALEADDENLVQAFARQIIADAQRRKRGAK